MNSEKIKELFNSWKPYAIAFGILILFVLGYNAGYRRAKGANGAVKVKVDTVTVTRVDTVRIAPELSEERHNVGRIVVPADEVAAVPCCEDGDNAPMDTIEEYVLEREQRVYKGKNYRAVVSGYDPTLDSLDVLQVTKYKTITKTETVRTPAAKWGFGISVGATAVYDPWEKKPHVGPGVTVGVYYRF